MGGALQQDEVEQSPDRGSIIAPQLRLRGDRIDQEHRSHPVPAGEEHVAAPEEKPSHPQARMGKPSNPFVAMQQAKRGAQRGR